MKHTVLITGASEGIGAELAKLFAINGHDLVLIARNPEKLLGFAEELREVHEVRVATFARNLCDPIQVKEIYDTIHSEGIFIDFLINNAGNGYYGAFAETDWAKHEETIQLNVTALTYLTYLFLQDMKTEGRGRIMNVASTAAFQPGPQMALHYAVKAYVLHFSEALYQELKKEAITVTTFCPGPTQTGFQAAAGLSRSRLVKGKTLASASKVAEYGFMAMMQGKRLAIPGMLNKIMVVAIRFLPRPVTLRLMTWMLKEI